MTRENRRQGDRLILVPDVGGSFSLKCDITQEDIDNGVPCECNKCPVALAIMRSELRDVIRSIEVCFRKIILKIYGNGRLSVYVADCPSDAKRFIESYDGVSMRETATEYSKEDFGPFSTVFHFIPQRSLWDQEG